MAEQTTVPRVVRVILGKLASESDAVAPESLVGLHGSIAGHAMRPARHGGSELGADEFVSQICELASLDGSLGWLAAMFHAATHQIATLPEAVVHAVWGSDPEAVATIAYRGSGAVGPDQRLVGRWESVVGAQYADWLVLPTENARRVLVPRAAARIDPHSEGFAVAGFCDVTIAGHVIDDSHAFPGDHRAAAIAMAGAAAAVTGSAEGVWRHHVEQMRARLATSYSGGELANAAPSQVARAASDIDATRLQIIEALRRPDAEAADARAYWQAVARARAAADHILGNSRHALAVTDPVTRLWRDVHTGCRLAAAVLDEEAGA